MTLYGSYTDFGLMSLGLKCRLAPESGHLQCTSRCLLCANSGHLRRCDRRAYANNGQRTRAQNSASWCVQTCSGRVAAPGWLTWRSRNQRYFRQCKLNVDTSCEAFFKKSPALWRPQIHGSYLRCIPFLRSSKTSRALPPSNMV